MQGIEIQFKDGKKDWIDPVEDDLADTLEPNENGFYVIDNSYAQYTYDASNIKALVMYDLDDDNHCTTCNGSGEGQYDGSRCHECKGSGVIKGCDDGALEREWDDYDYGVL